jgi:hypothetical protein
MKTLALASIALLLGLSAFAGQTEKTIAVPKEDQSIKIGFSSDGGKIEDLRIQHYPDSDDIAKAKKDPNEKQLTFWNFSVSNKSSKKVRMKIDITVICKDGEPCAHEDKTDTVDPEKYDDNIRIWVRMKVLDLINAKSAKLKLSIEPKS